MTRKRACPRCGYAHDKGSCPRCTRQYDKTERNQDAAKFYHSKFWRELRAACGARDKYICQSCGMPAGHSFHADHIVERESGGADELENLQCLCKRCHSRKTMRGVSK